MSTAKTTNRTDDYCARARKTESLSPAQERDLVDRYKAGDTKAGQALVAAHLNYAIGVAKKHNPTASSIDDMIQSASVGLLYALRSFDPSRSRFVTYANAWVRDRVAQWIHGDREIRLPMDEAGRTAAVSFRRTGEVDMALVEKHRAGLKNARAIADAVRMKRCSAEEHAFANDDTSLKDLLTADSPTPDPVMRISIEKAMRRLKTREQFVVTARMVDDMTFAEIGDALGMTAERARQIEKEATEKLRGLLAKTWDEYREAA
jgi:RNA polymerase sigma factor (sigma-70 family)